MVRLAFVPEKNKLSDFGKFGKKKYEKKRGSFFILFSFLTYTSFEYLF